MKPIAIRFTASFRGFGQAMPVSPHPARKKNLGFVLPKCSYELRDKDRYRPEHARAAPLALRLCAFTSGARKNSRHPRAAQGVRGLCDVAVPRNPGDLFVSEWANLLAVNTASGLLLRAFYTVPEQYQQSLGDRCAHCRVLWTLPAFGHSIARRSLDEVPSS
jgi:hypothetical protein